MLFLQVLFSQSFVYYNRWTAGGKKSCNRVKYNVFDAGGEKNEYDYGSVGVGRWWWGHKE